MFNFLSFFKKKPAESSGLEEKTSAPAEKQIQLDQIAVHTMPERFRHQPKKVDSAKTTGLLIIGGGVVVLVIASIGLYYYLFRQPTVAVKEEPSAVTITSPDESSQDQSASEADTAALGTLTATTTEPVVLPTDDGLATSSSTSTPEMIEQDLAVDLTPGLDTDDDGLTDSEEILLRTDIAISDTDGDGYADGSEILNLYDPAGPGRLVDNITIALYENKTFNYRVFYPSAWELSDSGGDDSIMFRSAANQLFQIIVQANMSQQSLDQWYLEQLDLFTINDSDRVSGVNWQGIINADGLTLYLMDSRQEYIFTLSYNPGQNNILEYANFFNMMIKSFSLKE